MFEEEEKEKRDSEESRKMQKTTKDIDVNIYKKKRKVFFLHCNIRH